MKINNIKELHKWLNNLLKEKYINKADIKQILNDFDWNNESNQVEAQVKPANDVIKIIDEMIATSIQIEAAELDAGEDCDNEILIDHQGRIYALTQLKNRLLV